MQSVAMGEGLAGLTPAREAPNASGEPLGRLVSELLARQLAERGRRPAPAPRFAWTSRPMGARVDLSDRDAVLDAMDEPRP